MFVLGNIMMGLGQALFWLFQIYSYILIARAVVSWVNADPRNAIVRFIVQVTEPPLRAVRRLLPASLRYFPLDIAFIVLFALTIFAQYAVAKTLVDAGARLSPPATVLR
jgi:YggT family protein